MEKRRYYVSVQAKTINETNEDEHYPIEIFATAIEIKELEELFNSEERMDDMPFIVTPVLYHDQKLNDRSDKYLTDVYQMLYNLGTLKTKKHIADMKILDKSEALADERQN